MCVCVCVETKERSDNIHITNPCDFREQSEGKFQQSCSPVIQGGNELGTKWSGQGHLTGMKLMKD